MEKVRISIYGRKYTVNSAYDESYIDKLADYVNNKIRELVAKNPRLDYADACALCLMNSADDYVSVNERYTAQASELEEQKQLTTSLSLKIKMLEERLSFCEKSNKNYEKALIDKDNEIVRLKMALEDRYSGKSDSSGRRNKDEEKSK